MTYNYEDKFLENHEDEFFKTANRLISDLKEFKEQYSESKQKKIDCLEDLAKLDKKKFVKKYKNISGATDFDLPDIIYAFS